MAGVPNQSASDLVAVCGRLKRALAQVQCAVFDLHEAFVQRDPQQREVLKRQAQLCLDRIRDLARNSHRA